LLGVKIVSVALNMAGLSDLIEGLPASLGEPGGAVAVVHEGRVAAQNCWGYADLRREVSITPQTMMPICSITKQFTCAAILQSCGDPERLAGALRAYLPLLTGRVPTVTQLCNNQSGLRDYPALSALCGVDAEGLFLPEDARSLIAASHSTHFSPGTQYAYSNSNFHILADLMENETGSPIGQLFADHIFDRAAMPTARLEPDSAKYDLDCVGYEADASGNFVPAINRSFWKGDAGISASLLDLVAWEQYIDAGRDDPESIYRSISHRQLYSNGSPAPYGFGLNHRLVAGRNATGHGGGMRGWRHYRIHLPQERLSVIVMLNHEGDARGTADNIVMVALNWQSALSHPAGITAPIGNYIDDDTGLSLRLERDGAGVLVAHLTGEKELLALSSGWTVGSDAMQISRKRGHVLVDRSGDHAMLLMRQITAPARRDLTGEYVCDELKSSLICTDTGEKLLARLVGFLGDSGDHELRPLGEDAWLLPSPRSIDVSPGDWTLIFRRDAHGNISGVSVSCWLARSLAYRRI
jgi:D-aminopeptidase